MIRNFDIQNLITLATFMAGAGSSAWGMLQYYSASEKKKFAAEREFQHLQRNQEQMKRNLEIVMRDLDELADDMKTQSACFNLLLSQSGQSMSGIFGYKRKNEPSSDHDP